MIRPARIATKINRRTRVKIVMIMRLMRGVLTKMIEFFSVEKTISSKLYMLLYHIFY